MTVDYYGPVPNGRGNIMFPSPHHPMRGGKFPPKHPCADNPKPMVFGASDQPESSDPLGKFRALGYVASCFPEGDGICFDMPDGRTSAQCIEDIRACFGWDVKVRRL